MSQAQRSRGLSHRAGVVANRFGPTAWEAGHPYQASAARQTILARVLQLPQEAASPIRFLALPIPVPGLNLRHPPHCAEALTVRYPPPVADEADHWSRVCAVPLKILAGVQQLAQEAASPHRYQALPSAVQQLDPQRPSHHAEALQVCFPTPVAHEAGHWTRAYAATPKIPAGAQSLPSGLRLAGRWAMTAPRSHPI